MIIPPSIVSVPRDQIMSPEDVQHVLQSDTVAVRIQEKGLAPKPGQLVGVRLNLNVMKTTGKAIQTIHAGTNASGYKRNKGFYGGEACAYAQVVHLKNAFFNVNQGGREAIATGQHHKFAMASVDGALVGTSVPDDFEGIEVRFNPKAHHLFVDMNDQAVHGAEDVIIMGNRAYARGAVYHTTQTVPKRAGDAPSQTRIVGVANEETVGAPTARRSRALSP